MKLRHLLSSVVALGTLGGLSLGGCGTTPQELDFVSGSRLKARYLHVDETLLFVSFYDTKRGEDCSFGSGNYSGAIVTGAGGVAHCLPTVRAGRVGFADATCTEPIFGFDEASPASVIIEDPANSCTDATLVFALGEPVQGNVFGRDTAGACVDHGPAPANLRVHHRGSPIALDAFVRAEERRTDGGGRLTRLVLEADDGARLTVGAYDNERDEAVSVDLGLDEPRWIPRAVAYYAGESLFADGACTRFVAIKDAYNAICPITAVYEFVKNACNGYDIRIHEGGPAVASAEVFARDDVGSCVPATVPGGTLTVEMGAEIAASAFSRAEITATGGSAVRQRYWGEVDEPPLLASGNLEYADTGAPCFIAKSANDGALRCYPSDGADNASFADAACTDLITGPVYDDACGQTGTPRPPAARVTVFEGDGARAFSVDPTDLALASVHAKNGSECVVYTPPTPQLWFRMTPLDDALFPIAFEQLDSD